jgi:hypothetical protein
MTTCVRSQLLAFASLLACCLVTAPGTVHATPYASNVSISGTTVNFILNEPADTLTYSLNGGAAVALNGTTSGAKTFSLGASTDTFSIVAEKNDPIGYTIPNGGMRDYATPNPDPLGPPLTTHGLNEPSPTSGLNTISDDNNLLTRFNSPRGVSVSNNPNAPNFGTVYVTNSAQGAVGGRTLTGEGVYALRADGSDAFGFGDAGQNPLLPDTMPAFITSSANSPYRAFVADDGNVYVSDWADGNANLFQLPQNLTSAINVLAGFGGPTDLPPGQTHGSIPAAWVEGSTAAANLTVYTIDEDLTTSSLTGGGSTTDRNSFWRYDIGAGPLPSATIPTQISDVLLAGPNADLHRGADGKWYLMQTRNQAANSTTLYVLSADGSTVLFDSLAETREIHQDPAFQYDILQYSMGMAVSPDQNWVALMLNGSDVAVLPLVDGIPDLEGRLIVDTGNFINSGRDITFDAAGNIHYVSSGQGRYRAIAPGGHTIAETSWNGTQYAFDVETVTVGDEDADFDGDGDVDGADFITWQRGLGISDGSADLEDGDANNDGNVNAADLAIWEGQFAVPAVAAGGAVPEPASGMMAAVAILMFAAAGKRRPQV